MIPCLDHVLLQAIRAAWRGKPRRLAGVRNLAGLFTHDCGKPMPACMGAWPR